jgi:hypothetical protein
MVWCNLLKTLSLLALDFNRGGKAFRSGGFRGGAERFGITEFQLLEGVKLNMTTISRRW